MGATLIEGAKWCGKTSTAANVARSALFMQDPFPATIGKPDTTALRMSIDYVEATINEENYIAEDFISAGNGKIV